MPPKRKTKPDAQSASTRATRSATGASSKAKAPASKSKSASKPASKRARAQSDDDDDNDDVPAGKKLKADDDTAQSDDEQQPAISEPKKMVTVLKRGAVPVDPNSAYVGTHQVYVNDEGVWDAMLNQTNVSQNANKYYVLQLLHPIGSPANCLLLTRWGRVGENGAMQVKGPWPAAIAINEFKKQFRSKAAVKWEDRVGMVAKPGKYTWLERSFENDDEPKDDDKQAESKKEEPIPDSTLAPELQTLCKLMFSVNLIDAHLSSMNYDAHKLPLGKLAKSTILNGFAALKTLSEVIENPNSDKAVEYGNQRIACEHFSSAYYSIIPHDFGRTRPIVIDNMIMLKKELELVDALGDMEIAQKLIQSSTLTDELGNPMNPLDSHFLSLGLSTMEPVASGSKEFDVLDLYARQTHGVTHRHYQVNVLNAFRVERQSETDAWNNSGFNNLGDGDRLLLWHGSRTTNFAGILKQGLRIAPPEAPSTGYMFGKGVYFADMMSKSANYCHAHLSNDTGLLLLCEIAAKPFFEQVNANYNASEDCKASNKLCTKGIGNMQPTKWKDAGSALSNPALSGCHMPDGPGQPVATSGGYLQYNEYIVYDPSQIRLRYLLMVHMA